jgi:RNA polymerase sigma factor (sigma-70 family)
MTTTEKPDPATLCRDYTPLARRLARKSAAGRPWLESDLESEAMCRLWYLATKWDPAKCPRFATFVHRFLPRKLWALVRAEAHHPSPGFRVEDEDGELVMGVELVADDGPDGTAAADARMDLPAVLADLRPRHREALRARVAEGRTFRELAGEMGVTAARVGQLVREAAERVRDRFEG